MKTVLWVVEEHIEDAWEYIDVYVTRALARKEAAFLRRVDGAKTRIVRFIREAA